MNSTAILERRQGIPLPICLCLASLCVIHAALGTLAVMMLRVSPLFFAEHPWVAPLQKSYWGWVALTWPAWLVILPVVFKFAVPKSKWIIGGLILGFVLWLPTAPYFLAAVYLSLIGYKGC